MTAVISEDPERVKRKVMSSLKLKEKYTLLYVSLILICTYNVGPTYEKQKYIALVAYRKSRFSP